MRLSQPAYLRYESGERTPSIHVIQIMADVLSTSVDYLLGKSDDYGPDAYYVRRSDDPELFEIVDEYKNNNSAKERLTAYFHSFQSEI